MLQYKGLYKQTLVRGEFEMIGKESDLQNHLFLNIDDVCRHCGLGVPIKVEKEVSKIVSGNKVRFDLLTTHGDGSITIFECKAKNQSIVYQSSALGQLLAYKSLINDEIRPKVNLVFVTDVLNMGILSVINENNLGVKVLVLDLHKALIIN